MLRYSAVPLIGSCWQWRVCTGGMLTLLMSVIMMFQNCRIWQPGLKFQDDAHFFHAMSRDTAHSISQYFCINGRTVQQPYTLKATVKQRSSEYFDKVAVHLDLWEMVIDLTDVEYNTKQGEDWSFLEISIIPFRILKIRGLSLKWIIFQNVYCETSNNLTIHHLVQYGHKY